MVQRTIGTMVKRSHLFPIVLAPLALVAGSVGAWLADAPHPLADLDDNFGQSLGPFGSSVAAIWSLVAAGCFVVVAIALTSRVDGPLLRHRRAVAIATAVVALLMLDHTLLMLLGYLPMLLIRLGMGHTDLLSDLASPGLAIQVALAAGLIGLLLALRRMTSAPTAYDDEELQRATQRTRKWTLIAMEAPLVYALSRVLMFLQVPGFTAPDFSLGLRLAGLGLAIASCVGVLLTWGLIRPWGERFPRWVLGLAGRRVPIDVAVIPALVVAALILAASRALFLDAFTSGSDQWREQLEAPLIGVPQLLWPLWGVALAMAALGYQRRRRAAEAIAGRGAGYRRPHGQPAP